MVSKKGNESDKSTNDDNNTLLKKGNKSDKSTKDNIFSRIGKKIEGIKEILTYKLPKAVEVVKLKGNEGVKELENKKFINEDNFRLQIGKMQKDGNTIYSPLMIRFGLEYIADHINTDGEQKPKAIIQLRPDLAQCLLQEDKKILTFEEEKNEIEKIIKKRLGKKGKFIEIQNVADNYPDVFDAVKKGKKGILPNKEPILEDFKMPLKSPLPIIKFLSFHANKDPSLMNVFYNTKPKKYKEQDEDNERIPGSSDADYYSIVEVGIRLFEVLNGISIQGGIGRQRVYDKIISLIIFGKDKIGKAKEYDANTVLELDNFPALKNLHHRLVNNGLCNDVEMNQLYIELNDASLHKIENKVKQKSSLIRLGAGAALVSALSFGGGYLVNDIVEQNKKRSNYDNRAKNWEEYNEKTRGLDNVGRPAADHYLTRESEEEEILISQYDLSQYNYKDKSDLFSWESGTEGEDIKQRVYTYTVERNRIVEEFHDAFYFYLKLTKGKILTAEEFMENYGGKLIDKYNIRYRKPYDHLKSAKMNAILNTIKYGQNITISKHNIKKLKEKKKFTYFIDVSPEGRQVRTFYRLKFIKVLVNGEYKEFVLAAKYDRYQEKAVEEFTIENGLMCMKDLEKNYGLQEIND